MRKLEASVTARINRWFAPIVPQSSPWEVKHTRGGGAFRFGELAEHQRDYLYAATTPTGFTYKIPDIGFSHPPCDVIHYKNTPAYVVICFNVWVTAIEIRPLLAYMENHRSLPEGDAVSICDFKVPKSKLPR